MKVIIAMEGVRSATKLTAMLCRDDAGRLVIFGGSIDLFDLLHWVDENPLAQFREITAADAVKPFEPTDEFKHLFSPTGEVL